MADIEVPLINCTSDQYDSWWQDNMSALDRSLKELGQGVDDEKRYKIEIQRDSLLALHTIMMQVIPPRGFKTYDRVQPLNHSFVLFFIFGVADSIAEFGEYNTKQQYNIITIVFQTLYGLDKGNEYLKKAMANLEDNEKTINLGGQNLRDIIAIQEQKNDSEGKSKKIEQSDKPLLKFLYGAEEQS